MPFSGASDPKLPSNVEGLSLEMISRERAERTVPLVDCGGRVYGEDEREDLIRYVLCGAEIQRDKDEESVIPNYEVPNST